MTDREYIMAVSIRNGLILLIEPDGQLATYRQRGVQTLSKEEIASEIKKKELAPDWNKYQELPKHYSIYFEDPEIMGRAVATYSLVLKKARDNRKKRANLK